MKVNVIISAAFSMGLILGPITAPAHAQEAQPESSPEAAPDGPSLMERGAELLFRGLREEMAPALNDLQDLLEEMGPSMGAFLAEMGPALADIASQVEDWSRYEMPEILPNGDIIIRKKPDMPPAPDRRPQASEPSDTGTIDL